jgi:molybdenum cofactor synthesis domain-containing protein
MSQEGFEESDVELQLFEKTEIWIKPIRVRGVDLTLLAEKVAEVLTLDKREVMVVDVRDEAVTLDIMRATVNAQDIIGKKGPLLQAIAGIDGVSLTPETTIHSEGVLGLIDIEDQEVAKKLIQDTDRMGRQILDRLKKRAIVFPSGSEIQKGHVQDSNTPYLEQRLLQEGFKVTLGDVLEDDLEAIAFALSKALDDGYGLIITTGGVGAEHKDRTIEALLKVDPRASTPYVFRYEKGVGRHEKDGVRIGVAFIDPSFIIALPGPHEEVRLGIEVIMDGLKRGLDKAALATSLSKKYVESFQKIHHRSSG